jgi:hypothetical protein
MENANFFPGEQSRNLQTPRSARRERRTGGCPGLRAATNAKEAGKVLVVGVLPPPGGSTQPTKSTLPVTIRAAHHRRARATTAGDSAACARGGGAAAHGAQPLDDRRGARAGVGDDGDLVAGRSARPRGGARACAGTRNAPRAPLEGGQEEAQGVPVNPLTPAPGWRPTKCGRRVGPPAACPPRRPPPARQRFANNSLMQENAG